MKEGFSEKGDSYSELNEARREDRKIQRRKETLGERGSGNLALLNVRVEIYIGQKITEKTGRGERLVRGKKKNSRRIKLWRGRKDCAVRPSPSSRPRSLRA